MRNPLDGWDAGLRVAARASDLLRTHGEPVLTRAILFDKGPGSNWHLRLHRDTTIAVAARVETPGYGPWSVKAGVHHVRPPRHVLEGMLTARVHLDDADEGNGCLRAVPGSHADAEATPADLAPSGALPIVVPAGDAVLMRPLLLHGSERSLTGRPRRVLHLEFAFAPLPPPLRWACVAPGT